MDVIKALVKKGLNFFNLRLLKQSTFQEMQKYKSLYKSSKSLNATSDTLCDENNFKLRDKINRIYGESDANPVNTIYTATKYICENNILGDFIECGVYKGKMIAAMMECLNLNNDCSRNIYLYDTFTGMTKAGAFDFQALPGQKTFMKEGELEASVSVVKEYLHQFDYPMEKLHFIEGDVTKTLTLTNHAKIALLRLDTDHYNSSLHELTMLYDKVVDGGIIIYDDYGHMYGQHKATNDFFTSRNHSPFLVRTSRKERVEICKTCH